MYVDITTKKKKILTYAYAQNTLGFSNHRIHRKIDHVESNNCKLALYDHEMKKSGDTFTATQTTHNINYSN